MRRAGLLLLTATSVAAASGCGASSAGPDPAAAAKAAYLAKAEAVCASANAELARVKPTQPTSTDKLPAYVKALVDVGRKNVEQLAALDPPPADRAQIQAKVIDPLKAQVVIGDAYVAKVTAAVRTKDPGLLGLITNPPTQTRADLDFMRAYGFRACVKAADTANA